MIDLTTKFSIPADVMAREVGDEIVLLDLASGNYFGLDQVGARIWQSIADGDAPAAACAQLLSEYAVSREQLDEDMQRLLGDLLDRGLLQPA